MEQRPIIFRSRVGRFGSLTIDEAKLSAWSSSSSPPSLGTTAVATAGRTLGDQGSNFTFQWMKDGQKIEGATSKLLLRTLQNEDAGR